MQTKTVYQLDQNGVLIGTTSADESPLEPGNFLIPAGCVDASPLPPAGGKGQRFVDGDFVYFDLPKPNVPPPPALADVITAAVRQIDTDVDAVYAAVIGNRQAEYDLAEKDAQAYKAASYSGTAPASVQGWADAKKQTAKWAADDILATSVNWRTLQANIRANRLARKEDIRAATTAAGVDAVLATWAGYVTKTRAALGV